MSSEQDRMRERLLMLFATVPAGACIAVTIYVLVQAWPFLSSYDLQQFLLSSEWLPNEHRFGVLPMIVGSVCVTSGAVLLGTPLGLGAGIFIAEVAPPRIREVTRLAVLLLSGVPPVVYGFFGLVFVVPFMRELFGGSGFSILAASIMLAIMILPTLTVGTERAIRSVKTEYQEAGLALGATRRQLLFTVLLPIARRGIVAALVLGLARSIGETLIVLMVSGNVVQYPASPTDPVRTLTGNIALETAYSAGLHRQAIFATAIVLLAFIASSVLILKVLFRDEQQHS